MTYRRHPQRDRLSQERRRFPHERRESGPFEDLQRQPRDSGNRQSHNACSPCILYDRSLSSASQCSSMLFGWTPAFLPEECFRLWPADAGYWILDTGSLFNKTLRVAGCRLRVQATILCLEKWHGAFIHCIGVGSNGCWNKTSPRYEATSPIRSMGSIV